MISVRHSSFHFNKFLYYQRPPLLKAVPTLIIINYLLLFYFLNLVFIFQHLRQIILMQLIIQTQFKLILHKQKCLEMLLASNVSLDSIRLWDDLFLFFLGQSEFPHCVDLLWV